jgi:o-succinylbenzoate synthase
MRITEVRLREIRLPLREPFRISSGVVQDRRILLVELVDGDGTHAWSECVAGELPNYSSETVDTAWLAIREWLAPRLLHAEAAEMQSPAQAYDILRRGVRGHRMARAALEMGTWALHATRAGRALADVIGGTRDRIEFGISIGIQESAEALAERAAHAVSEGYRRIKLKIEPGADVDYVAAVRDRVGAHAPLMVDANNAYTLHDTEHLARLDDFDLMMIEQPLDADDLVRHAQLQRTLRTPLCLDESITSVDRALDMITLGSGRIINIKPGRVGGFAQSIAIHDACRSSGVPVWCGGMLESGVGRAYNVALASLPGFTMPGDISPSARYWERDIVSPEWQAVEPGWIEVPRHAPGIGVAVDVGRIDDLTVRSHAVRR